MSKEYTVVTEQMINLVMAECDPRLTRQQVREALERSMRRGTGLKLKGVK